MHKLYQILSLLVCTLLIGSIKANATTVNTTVINIGEQSFYVYPMKKGDSLYGISQKLDWNYETLTSFNTIHDTKSKDNQLLFYPVESAIVEAQTPETQTKEIILYYVKENDSLLDIAQSHNTSIEHLFELNPALSFNNLNEIHTIKIEVNSNIDKIIHKTAEIRQVYKFKPYKVAKSDTWTSIASANNISVEELQSANTNIRSLQKGGQLYIPQFELVTKEITHIESDNRETSYEGIYEIYKDVHNTSSNLDSIQTIDIAIITNISENKTRDAELLKGFLMGIDYMKDNIHSINLSVFDTSNDSLAISKLVKNPELAEFEFVLSTTSNGFSSELATFGKENDIEIINLFDIKNDEFRTNNSVIQFFPPSTNFNQMTASYILENFKDNTFVFIGKSKYEDPNATENIIKAQLDSLEIPYIHNTSISQLTANQYDNNKKYLFIPNITKTTDIDKFLSAVIELKAKHPMAEYHVIGKPNWIAVSQGIQEYFHKIDTYIPSRFYYNTHQTNCQEFEEEYCKNYGYKPIHTNPVFAAVGYDIARYFIENYFYNNNDMNNFNSNTYDALQTDFNLIRLDNWSGLYNHTSYLIHLTPFNTIERIKIQ